ncbi:mitochondrial transcription rescue factor 1 [Anabrus simplex]|uniref:mitochondrial transcription rescue factor 1 n=1 Tax=Anabrus simplex TaxID=316456 RepID=UPI0035A372E5
MLNKGLHVFLRTIKHLEFGSKQYRSITRWSSSLQSKFLCQRVLTCDIYKYALVPCTLQSHRSKYTKKDSRSQDEGSDSEDESFSDDWDREAPEKGSKVMSVTVPSLRADLLIKSGLQMARNKVETIFYQSRIRVNGKKILKKSAQITDGDEVDVIRGYSPMNPNFLVVSRIEVLSIKAKEETFSVKMRRSKSLVIENYSDPWKQSQSQE